jgi:putative membrane protein
MFRTAIWLAGVVVLAVVGGTPAGAQPPMSPRDFLSAAAQSDQYEIEAGRVALTQSENGRVRAFAQQMVDDHTRTGEALREAARASGLPPPPSAMSGDQQKMLSALQSMTGADLDRTYATQQVNAHTAALVTEQAYAAAGSDPNLRKVAQSGAPLIEHHLGMARQMKASLGGS